MSELPTGAVRSFDLARWKNGANRMGRKGLRLAAAALLALLGSALSWAGGGLAFQGLVQVLNTGSSLLSPSGIAVGGSGNLYISDSGNNQIVMINPQGVAAVLNITVSPALAAPAAITVDGAGNLYIADTENNRVVEVTPAGVSSVVSLVGLTLSLPQGIALDPFGNIFIADTGHSRIVKVTSGGTAAVFTISGVVPATPAGLAVDTKGNLYIADSSGNQIVTVAAPGTVGVALIINSISLATPTGVAVDGVGNVYVAETGYGFIIEVSTAGNGTALQMFYPVSQTLSGALGVAVDVFGTIYVADTGNSRVLAVDRPASPLVNSSNPNYSLNNTAVGFGHVSFRSSTPVTLPLTFTVFGTLGGVAAYTSGAQSLDFTVTTGTNSCTTGTVFQCVVYVQFLPTAAGLRTGAVVLYDGASPPNPILTVPLYGFSDSPVAALAPNIGSVISTGSLITSLPFQLALDGVGNIFVGDYTGMNVTKVTAGGGSASVVPLGTPGGIAVQNITGVALDGAGNLFIGDHENGRILVVTPGGVVSVLSISGLSPSLGFPVALVFDAAGNLYISDFTNGRVIRVTSLSVAGSTSSGNPTVINTGSFSFTGSTLTGMTVDSQGTIYIAARTDNSSSIVKVTASGVASVLATSGITLSDPQGVGVDGMGNVYVVDAGHNRIVEITTVGVASILSLSGLTNPSTLGSSLFGVTVDASGNIYIPDWSNNRIVFVNVSGAALTFASTKVGFTSTDSPKTATVTNLGNQPLAFSASPTFTANFSQPTGSSNQCLSSTSLTIGTVCNVSVQFTPQAVGNLSAGITVTNDTLNVAGSTQQVSVSGTGLTPGDTTATAVSTNPTAANIGQPLTVSATVTDTATGHTSTIPTGGVTFMDTIGSTVVSLNGGNTVTLVSGVATLTGVTLSGAGTHTITANYAGVSGSFIASSNTTTLVVSKTVAVVAGPASQPVQVTNGQAGSVTVTVTGPYGALTVPSGSVAYNVVNSSSTSVASGSAPLTAGSTDSTATVPIASSLAAGVYTITATYSGDSNYAASPTAITIQLVIGQITPAISWTQPPSAITYGTVLTALLNAAALNGSTTISGSFVYTATLQGGAPSAITGATVLGAGVYTLTAIFTPTDATTYSSASASVTLTVAQAAPMVALISSANTVLVTNSVIFTATVSSAAGTPSGSVSFFDGITLLGSGALTRGIATYTTSNLAVGAHTVTAQYGGSSNFSILTSSALTETVEDFTLNIATGGTTSATVTPGGVATYALVIGPSIGTSFPSAVFLSITGLPPGATGTLTPSKLPADAGPTNVSLMVKVPLQSASLLLRHNILASRLSPAIMGMLILPLEGKIRRSAGQRGRMALLLFVALLMTSLAGLTACGSKNSGFLGSPQRSYPLTVTATSGTLSHSTTLTLTVQ